MKGVTTMTKIEILLKATTMNEQSLIKACEAYPVPVTKADADFLDELINRVREMKSNLPHGKSWSGVRRLRTWCIDILEEKKEEYLINTLTNN